MNRFSNLTEMIHNREDCSRPLIKDIRNKTLVLKMGDLNKFYYKYTVCKFF